MRSQSRDRAFRAFGPLLAALALVGAPGCGEEKAGTPTTEPQREELSAGQILNVAMLLNHAEIAQAQVSINRLRDPQVTELAQKVTVDHTAAQNKIDALSEKMRAKPEESELGQDIRRVGDSMTQQLRNAPTPDFDLNYLEV
jgi:predicted outer membrane protein